MPISSQHPSITDFQDLVALHERQQAELRVVAAGHAQLADQMAEITVTLRKQDEMIAANDSRLRRIEESGQETHELLHDIKDAVTAGRVIKRLAAWAGGTIVTASAAWLALERLFKP